MKTQIKSDEYIYLQALCEMNEVEQDVCDAVLGMLLQLNAPQETTSFRFSVDGTKFNLKRYLPGDIQEEIEKIIVQYLVRTGTSKKYVYPLFFFSYFVSVINIAWPDAKSGYRFARDQVGIFDYLCQKYGIGNFTLLECHPVPYDDTEQVITIKEEGSML